MANVQIRDVPADVHETLKRRAEEAGTSLSEYLRSELARLARLPTTAELIRRIEARELYEFDAAEVIRTEREERERQLADH